MLFSKFFFFLWEDNNIKDFVFKSQVLKNNTVWGNLAAAIGNVYFLELGQILTLTGFMPCFLFWCISI